MMWCDTHGLVTERDGTRSRDLFTQCSFPFHAAIVCVTIWRAPRRQAVATLNVSVVVSPPHRHAPRFGVASRPVCVTQSNKSNVIHTNILVARRVIFTLVLSLLGVLYAARWYYYSDDYDILYAYNKIINKGWSVLLLGSLWSVSDHLPSFSI